MLAQGGKKVNGHVCCSRAPARDAVLAFSLLDEWLNSHLCVFSFLPAGRSCSEL